MRIEKTLYKYTYDYNGEELNVFCPNNISKKRQIETAKEMIIKERGSFDEDKLVFKKSTTISGYVDKEGL